MNILCELIYSPNYDVEEQKNIIIYLMYVLYIIKRHHVILHGISTMIIANNNYQQPIQLERRRKMHTVTY